MGQINSRLSTTESNLPISRALYEALCLELPSDCRHSEIHETDHVPNLVFYTPHGKKIKLVVDLEG